jgi:glycerol-3-phosphate acyltransferase PlsY
MTGDVTTLSVLLSVAYLIGSVPTGLLLGKMYGIDVRKEGSGNIGATNLYRTVGRKVGLITLVCDCLKGLLPVLIIKLSPFPPEFAAFVALSAFCGHVFSVFLRFKGGKGVATALGVFLALAPQAVAVAIAIFVLLMFIWRYVSLGSILAAAVMPPAVYYMHGSGTVTVVTSVIAVIVIFRHYENIKRLLSGNENKFKA